VTGQPGGALDSRMEARCRIDDDEDALLVSHVAPSQLSR
jgi:hypothetical protein